MQAVRRAERATQEPFDSTAAFKPLRAREASNPNPLIVTNDWIGQGSEQVAAHVCCRGCEDIFNEGGEKWLLPLLANLDGFPLYEMVAKANPYTAITRRRSTTPETYRALSSERLSISVWQSSGRHRSGTGGPRAAEMALRYAVSPS